MKIITEIKQNAQYFKKKKPKQTINFNPNQITVFGYQ